MGWVKGKVSSKHGRRGGLRAAMILEKIIAKMAPGREYYVRDLSSLSGYAVDTVRVVMLAASKKGRVTFDPSRAVFSLPALTGPTT